MAFADEITKNDSKRVTFVTVSPKIDQTLFSYTQTEANVRYIDIPFRVTNMSGRTAIGYIPTSADSNRWYYDSTTNRLYYTGASILGNSFSDSIITYMIGLTTGETVRLPYDFVSGETIMFDARLQSPPRVTSDISNSLYGILSISASPLEIINTDRYYSFYLAHRASWLNAEVVTTLCVNGEYKRIFTGIASNVYVNDGVVSVSVKSKTSVLQKTNDYGTGDTRYINCSSLIGSFAENDKEKPIPYFNYQTKTEYVPMLIQTYEAPHGTVLNVNTTGVDFKCFRQPDETVLAKRETVGGAWQFCYKPSFTTITSPSFGTISSFTVYNSHVNYRDPTFDVNGNFVKFTPNPVCFISSSAKVPIGTSITITSGIYNGFKLIIMESSGTGPYTHYGAIQGGYLGTTSTIPTMTLSPYVPVTLEVGDKLCPLIQGLDYSYGGITIGDVYKLTVSFNPTTVGYAFNVGTITSDNTKVHVGYTISNASYYIGNDIDKVLLNASGAGVTTTLPEYSVSEIATFKVPEVGSSETYLTTLERLLKSIGAYIRVNGAGEFELGMFSQVTSTAYSITTEDILKNTFNVNINYEDIYTDFYTKNEITNNSITTYSANARLIHGFQKRADETNLLATPSTSARLGNLRAIRSAHVTEYSFRTSHRFAESQVGDRVTITHPDILTSTGSANCIVTSVAISETSVSIKAINIGSL